jgi:hypothetical protein
MTTVTKPPRSDSSFVAGAPDAKPKPSKQEARRRQITMTVPLDMLCRPDALAAETGQTRAGLLLLGAVRLLRVGV